MFKTQSTQSQSTARISLFALGLTLAFTSLGCARGTLEIKEAPSAASAPLAEGAVGASPAALPTRERICSGGTVTTRAELAALQGCTTLLGDLTLTRSEFTHLEPLAQLSRVTGSLEISKNAQLRSLSGLERLRAAASLRLVDNPRLASVRALSRLTHLEHLEIVRAPLLESSTGLEGLTELHSLTLCHTGLARVVGLRRLTRIDQLEISHNPYLISLAALDNVRVISRIEVYKNRWLNGSRREFFPELTHASHARIEDNVAFSPSELARAKQFTSAPALARQDLLAQK